MTSPVLVAAGPSHAAVMAALHALCFDDPWNEKACREVLSMPGCVALMATDAEVPLGFVVLTVTAGEAEVVSIGVAPDHRGTGLARTLLGAALAAAAKRGARRCVLEVAVDNGAAKGLYEHTGFREAGRRKGYYRRPAGRVDALILARDL